MFANDMSFDRIKIDALTKACCTLRYVEDLKSFATFFSFFYLNKKVM